MTVISKQRPENTGHRKTYASIRNVGKGSPLGPLPQKRGTMAATRAGSRLTCVVNEPLLGLRGINFRAQSRGPAIEHSCEVLANGERDLGAIPIIPCGNQNLLQGLFVGHVSAKSSYGPKAWNSSSVIKTAFPGAFMTATLTGPICWTMPDNHPGRFSISGTVGEGFERCCARRVRIVLLTPLSL